MDSVTDAVSTQQIREHFSVTAADVDSGALDVRGGLLWLGQRGQLLPAADPDQRVRGTVRLLRTVASVSLADAFAAWSQAMVVDYLTRFPEPSGVVERLKRGTMTGATALAPAVADVAGGPPVSVVAEPDGHNWILTGPVPWASNLFPGAALVTPARTPDGGRLVALLSLDSPGVEVAPSTTLLALDGTGTSSIQLRGARVAAKAVLSRDLKAFLGECRPVMLLTQAALALGVADAALDAARLDGPAEILRAEHCDLVTRRDVLAERVAAGEDAVRARIEALQLVARAVELEGLSAAGSGFRARSATSRRRREAAFLPLQAPTLLQLRASIANT